MKRLFAILLLAAASYASAAPTPYPITVNSQSSTMPKLELYRSSQRTIRVTFTDGSTASDITGYTPWMSWSTSSVASSNVAASASIVVATNGTADFMFTAADLNYTPGRYYYQVGVTTGGVATVYRSGILTILGSPYTSGATAADFSSPINWANFTYLATAASGPYRAGTNVSFGANADGSVDVNAATQGDITAVNIAAGSGMTGTVATASGDHDQTIALNAASIASLLLADSAIQQAGLTTATGFVYAAGAEYADANVAALSNALDSVAFAGETDPVWTAVSNTVVVNAANGATAYGWGNSGTNGLAEILANGSVAQQDITLRTTGDDLSRSIRLSDASGTGYFWQYDYDSQFSLFYDLGGLSGTVELIECISGTPPYLNLKEVNSLTFSDGSIMTSASGTPPDNPIVMDEIGGKLYLGKTAGTTYLRGTVVGEADPIWTAVSNLYATDANVTAFSNALNSVAFEGESDTLSTVVGRGSRVTNDITIFSVLNALRFENIYGATNTISQDTSGGFLFQGFGGYSFHYDFDGAVNVDGILNAGTVTGTTVHATHLGGTAAADYATDAEAAAAYQPLDADLTKLAGNDGGSLTNVSATAPATNSTTTDFSQGITVAGTVAATAVTGDGSGLTGLVVGAKAAEVALTSDMANFDDDAVVAFSSVVKQYNCTAVLSESKLYFPGAGNYLCYWKIQFADTDASADHKTNLRFNGINTVYNWFGDRAASANAWGNAEGITILSATSTNDYLDMIVQREAAGVDVEGYDSGLTYMGFIEIK